MSKLAEALRKLAEDIDAASVNRSVVRKLDLIEASSLGALRIGFEIELGTEVTSQEFFDRLREAFYSRG